MRLAKLKLHSRTHLRSRRAVSDPVAIHGQHVHMVRLLALHVTIISLKLDRRTIELASRIAVGSGSVFCICIMHLRTCAGCCLFQPNTFVIFMCNGGSRHGSFS